MADPLEAPPGTLGFRMPAEFEPHTATWLAWPHDPLTWVLGVEAAERAYDEMIQALVPGERVEVLVRDQPMAQRVQERLTNQGLEVLDGEGAATGPDRGVVRLHVIDYADAWLRDTGPTFVVRGDGARAAVDWRFNAWGDKYESLKRDDRLAERIAAWANTPRWRTEVVLEGGAIDPNGHGTILTTEQCLLNPNRGPERTIEGMETLLRDALGATNVLWLTEGLDGDDTDGHLDDLARFVDRRTVLVGREPDTSDPNHAVLEDAISRLATMTDERAKPLEIVELPMPDPVNAEGTRVPATYVNLYIANEVVLVPVFEDPADRDALEIIGSLFPHRRVAPIPATPLVAGFGACHCLTQQEPAPP